MISAYRHSKTLRQAIVQGESIFRFFYLLFIKLLYNLLYNYLLLLWMEACSSGKNRQEREGLSEERHGSLSSPTPNTFSIAQNEMTQECR